MIDPRAFRRNPEAVAEALTVRGYQLDLDRYRELEKARHDFQTETENLQHERNIASREIGRERANGVDVQPLIEAMGAIGIRLDVVKQEFENVQAELDEFLLTIPNIPDSSVPPGNDEEDNVELRRWGDIPRFSFDTRDHISLAGEAIDVDAGAKITGSRFHVIRGQLAHIHRGLIQMMMDLHVAGHGYEEVYVPFIVNRDTMQGTGQLPKFESDLFKVDSELDYYLIPTAEVPVTNLVKDRILDADELPLKFVSHTPCFRKEAGSYGRDTHGIIRQHQFEKVELVQIVRPAESWDALDELTHHAERVLQLLELPYRAVVLCGGDLGFAAAKTVDLEVWLPGSQKYREISSCSNFLDFQARRSRIRWRPDANHRPEHVHTINGSGLAVGRTLIALMENYQQQGGSISIPDALRPYVGGLATVDPVATADN